MDEDRYLPPRQLGEDRLEEWLPGVLTARVRVKVDAIQAQLVQCVGNLGEGRVRTAQRDGSGAETIWMLPDQRREVLVDLAGDPGGGVRMVLAR
jgi:hypothetical protein